MHWCCLLEHTGGCKTAFNLNWINLDPSHRIQTLPCRCIYAKCPTNRGGRKVDSRYIDCRHIAKCDSCQQFDCRIIARLSPIINPPHPLKSVKTRYCIETPKFWALFVMQLEMIHLGTHNTPHFCNISCFTSCLITSPVFLHIVSMAESSLGVGSSLIVFVASQTFDENVSSKHSSAIDCIKLLHI